MDNQFISYVGTGIIASVAIFSLITRGGVLETIPTH